MNNHNDNGQQSSMAPSNPALNQPWPSQPAQTSGRHRNLRTNVLRVESFIRHRNLRTQVLRVETFIRLLDEADDDIAYHNIAYQDIDIQDLSMQSVNATTEDISMASVHENNISMVSAESLMDAENQN